MNKKKKKKNRRVFARGWNAEAQRLFGLSTSQLLAVATSGGQGLLGAKLEAYLWMWDNRHDALRPDFLPRFEAADRRHTETKQPEFSEKSEQSEYSEYSE